MCKEVSEKLEAQNVARNMFQCNALTLEELLSIQSKRNESINAAKQLLDIVMSQSGNVYGFFMNALKQTGQKHVYEMIVNDSYQGKISKTRDSTACINSDTSRLQAITSS